MAGLGVRVGSAYVNTNLRFNSRSIDLVGRQMHRQLARIGEHNRGLYQSLGRESVALWRASLGTLVTGAPLIGSAFSGVAGAATMLAASLRESIIASGGLVGVAGSVGFAMTTMSYGFNHVRDAIAELDPKRLEMYLSAMTPPAREFTLAMRDLNSQLREQIQPRLFAGLLNEMQKLRQDFIPMVVKGFLSMADAINVMFKDLSRYLGSDEGLKTVNTALQGSAKIFSHLAKAVVPFLDGFLKFHNALIPASTRLADRITDIAKRFQRWTSAPGFAKRIDDRMKMAEKTAGLLFKTLGNLWSALSNVFTAANGPTNSFLEMLVEVTARFKEWSASAEGKASIVTWLEGAIDVMAAFGRAISSVFKVTTELADPRVIVSFLDTVRGAFEHLGRLPLADMVTAFVTIAEAIQPISSALLAVIVAGVSFNIFIGAIAGQLGGVVNLFYRFRDAGTRASSVFSKFGGSGKHVAAAATPMQRMSGLMSRITGMGPKFSATMNSVGYAGRHAGKSASAMGGLAAMLGRITGFGPRLNALWNNFGHVAQHAGKATGPLTKLLGFLGRIAKFAGPVGLAIWVGTLIAKSEELQEKLGNVWGALKEVFSAIGEAFSEISTAAGPIISALGPVFDIMDKIASLALGVVLDTITYAFKSLANIIKGVGKIIGGFLDVIVGLFTLDFSKVWDGLKKMASGLWPLLQGVFGIFITFFAPARLAKLGLGALGGLWSGLRAAMPKILGWLGQFIGKMLGFFITLTPRLIGYGARALSSFGSAVGRAIPGVLSWFGRLISGIFSWFGRLPGRLLSLGQQGLSKFNGAVAAAIPKVLALAGRIINGIIQWFARLPGRLLSFGQQAITKVNGAIGAGVGKLRAAAGKIVNAVVDTIKKLPERLFNIAKQIPAKIASGITGGIGKVKDAIGGIAKAVTRFWPGSPVKEGPLTAWNRGSDASGGGHNVIEALSAGLRDVDPIRKAMAEVTAAVSRSVGTSGITLAGGGGTQVSRTLQLTIMNPRGETSEESLTRTYRNLAYLGLA